MDQPEQSHREEEEIARLLRAAGPRPELPAQLKATWEETFRAELQPVLERRKRNFSRIATGLCASVAIFFAALWFSLSGPAAPQVAIRVSHVSGDHRLGTPSDGTEYLRVGQQLSSGSIIHTGEDGFVAVKYNDYDLRLNHNTRVAFDGEHIQLLAGDLYASDEPGATNSQPLLIETPHGTIRDIGTQFTVNLLPHQTVTTVRRGAVLINTGAENLRAEALPDRAVRVTVDDKARMQETLAEPSGADWNWIYQGVRDFELEGHSAHDFLLWSVRESGLQLQFASVGAEIYADTTVLHGDFGKLNPEQAVAPVLATTDLEARRVGNNTLLVALKIGH